MVRNINVKTTVYTFPIIMLAFLSACSSGNKNDEAIPNSDPAVVVTLALPLSGNQDSISISGQIEASQSANISTRIMGIINTLKVSVGDHVSKGQVLATISNQDILAKRAQTDAAIMQAQATLTSAQKDYDRFTILYKQQSATAKELDNVTLQYNSAKAGLEAAKQMRNEVNAMLNYAILTAPFSGIITQKLADAGSMANPGMPLLTIEQKGTYQVSAAVPETEINEVKDGQQVTVTVKSIGKIFTGKVTQVNQSSQFTGGQYIIKISIPDKDKNGLYAGMYVNVSIASATTAKNNVAEDALLVPVSSIIDKDQLTGLYTVSADNTALLRWLRLGKTYGDKVEVLSGLGKDEQFILTAKGKLYNGVPVKISN